MKTTPFLGILTVFILLPFLGISQDLLVTTAGDSLEVKVTQETNTHVYYSMQNPHTGSIINGIKPHSEISSIIRNYRPAGTQQGEEEIIQTGEVVPENMVGFRFGLQGGYSRRIGKTPEGLNQAQKSYIEEMRNGFFISGDLTYFFNEKSGVGVTGDMFSSTSSTITTLVFDDGTSETARMKEKVRLLFIGPYYAMRFFNWNKTNYGLMKVGLGYLGYNNDIEVIFPMTAKSATASALLEFGYDFKISETMALGVVFSYYTGVLMELEMQYPDGTSEVIELDKSSYENVGRINLGVGLRFM